MFKNTPSDEIEKLHQMADAFAQILVAQIDANIIKNKKSKKQYEKEHKTKEK